MAISRAQLAKELEPGLNSLFGMSYDSYDREYEEIFAIEDSQRAFEEEVLITGFGSAPTKTEERRSLIMTTMMDGLLKDIEHYKSLQGELTALNLVESEISQYFKENKI